MDRIKILSSPGGHFGCFEVTRNQEMAQLVFQEGDKAITKLATSNY